MAISLDTGLTLQIGDHSHIHGQRIRNPGETPIRIRIGRFCSIAGDLTIIGGGPPSDGIATFPFSDPQRRALWQCARVIPSSRDAGAGGGDNCGDITIGNDVWIGYNVKLLRGVSIGDGAVIEACSLVDQSVEPYTRVGGIPARSIRKRFSDRDIAFLEKIKWWNWPDAMINRHMSSLCGSDLAALETLLGRDPDYRRIESEASAEQCLVRADAAYARDDLAGACAALKQGLAYTPDAVALLVCLGNVRFRLGAFAEALQSFRRAAEIRPDDADIQVRLANAAWHCGDAKLFELCTERALKLSPGNADALRLSIHRHLEQGRFAEGADQCCALLPSNPNDLLLLLQLGKCLREIHDADSARWCYQHALEVDPACQIAREALQRLNSPTAAPVPPLPRLDPGPVAVPA